MFRIASLLLTIAFAVNLQAQEKEYIVYKVYDFDDTIMHTTSKIYIYADPDTVAIQGATKELGISTEKFAEVGEMVGKPGVYKHYGYRGNSFRDFANEQSFRATIEDTLRRKHSSEWLGPAWENWLNDVSNPEQMHRTFILTARRQSAGNILDGLVNADISEQLPYKYRTKMRGNGLAPKDYRLENIAAVGNSPDTEKAKLEKLMGFCEQAEKEVLENIRNGKSIKFAIMEFNDDDYQNDEKAIEGLMRELHRWPHVRVWVTYVGNTQHHIKPQSINVNAVRAYHLRKCSNLFSGL